MAELLKNYVDIYESIAQKQGVEKATESSAFLLTGEDADGLYTLSRIIAAKLLGIGKENYFTDYADIVVYPIGEAKKRNAISVDDVREIIDSLYLSPFDFDKRVFIIRDAHTMSEICQNKLLKSLEEPPKRVCFILCATQKLLATVESRCRKIEVEPLPVELICERLKASGNTANAELCAKASRGNPGMAARMSKDAEFVSSYKAAVTLVSLSTGSRNFVKAAAVYEGYSREKADAVMGLMEYVLADVIRLISGSQTVFDKADIQACASGFTAYSAATCADFVRTAKQHNAANCMVTAVMDELILKIMEERVLCQKL